jgi:hypothetical protein
MVTAALKGRQFTCVTDDELLIGLANPYSPLPEALGASALFDDYFLPCNMRPGYTQRLVKQKAKSGGRPTAR